MNFNFLVRFVSPSVNLDLHTEDWNCHVNSLVIKPQRSLTEYRGRLKLLFCPLLSLSLFLFSVHLFDLVFSLKKMCTLCRKIRTKISQISNKKHFIMWFSWCFFSLYPSYQIYTK